MKSSMLRIFPKPILAILRLINNTLIRKGYNLYRLKLTRSSNNIVIIGNGPSLKEDLDEIKKISESQDYDFFCVNNFAQSEYYSTIKPNQYLFIDDYFFSRKAHIDWIATRTKTFKIIDEETNWQMQIIIPAQANLKEFKSHFSNPNLTIKKFATTELFYSSNLLNRALFSTGYFGPFQGNVLIYSLYLSIWMNYNTIKIFGADLNFHNNITVDSKTNQLMIRHQHFFEDDSFETFLKNPEKVEAFTMTEFMYLTFKTFQAHEILSNYAKSLNIKVLNCSKFSLIDSYSRP